MDIVIIYEENHGTIGVAESLASAIDYLIRDKWVTEKTEIYIDDYGNLETLKEQNISLDKVRTFDLKTFNKIFEGNFYLEVDKLIK